MAEVWIDGQRVPVAKAYPVYHKYRHQVIDMAGEADDTAIALAVESATRARTKPLSVHERYRILEKAADLLQERHEEFATLICQEAGKPLKDARTEVSRGQQTLRYAAVAARTLHGEEVPVRGNPGSENRLAFTVRKPYGTMLAITPFNFPLNLVLHKVAPAIAGGNAVILKPAPQTPLTAMKLAELMADAGLPPGWLNVLTGSGPELGQKLVSHPGIQLISFTGSQKVGQEIRAHAGLKPVLLELGNNSANIVHEDADMDLAAKTLAARAFGYAGQVCIAVQRIYVQRNIFEPFQERLIAASKALVVGDPEDPRTDVGPMITEDAANRAWAWYEDALQQGAQALLPAEKQGALVTPTILVNVAPSMQVMAEEVFAPLAGLVPYDTIDEAIAWANESRYGLQAGVFTRSLSIAIKCAQELEVGGVIINDSSSYRADNMPYGGIKDSGLGREGPEYAILEMTYPTVVVLNL
ncbi:Acyl-CoA reductase [Sulfobacillus thermosulfidooxidans DSM 9293]|uniref:Acyl-CoA reductase n=1 Tax=Sulfobacillus thermosulfidooxidans (strain DSM 9293 / VKM B-1269 / AT-1) TaxID=929705 RepID=A0A1W1W936_SULTA|nr:aldehyde dehydrogenase family protein [Sulfobacillus thermosulfidooxidans]SMC02755.1 Acyl-CoA reductase [Sulfobacillus thermosulfidooxidans DSM 9293]